ncbi:putative multidrug resistance protein [Aureobasidium pullulans]|uniref:Putative multidrug resistance protein n=1 Tax=Aureobasidium pullulans TaxID=5580 RepID=A0A4S8X819_AURPU|nr:putative multidrug resistance protein [Aureobasidium pullulans]
MNITHQLSAERCSHSADNHFGPVVSPQCRDFDFTLYFEQAFLSLTPSVMFILASLIYLPTLTRQTTKVRTDRLHGVKLTFAALYAASQLAMITILSVPLTPKTKLSLPASVLAFAASLVVCLFSHFGHVKSIRSSTLLSTFLFFSCVCDIVQARTFWMLANSGAVSHVFTTALSLKVGLLVLDAQGKQNSLLSSYRSVTPESLSNVYSRSVFWWLNKLFMQGFKKDLTLDTLFELDDLLDSTRLASGAQRSWDRVDKTSKYALGKSLMSCLAWPILMPAIPRLVMIGFNYSQPFLVTRLIDLLSQDKASPDDRNIGYGLIGATAIIYIGIAISTGRYKHQIYRSMTMLRGALVALIYHKTLELRLSAVEDSASSTLMSTDVDTVITATQQLHEIWGSAAEVAIGMYLLGRLVGVGAVAPVCLTIFGTLINSLWVGPELSRRRPEWNKAIQDRVALTSSMLHDMKSLKMLGLVGTLKDILQARRIEELKRSKKVRWMIVWMNAASNLMETFSPALVLMALSLQRTATGQQPLTTSQAYTILSILSLVANPLSDVLSSIPGMIGCIGCLGRIQTYLLHDSIKPYPLSDRTDISSQAHSVSGEVELDTFTPDDAPCRLSDKALAMNNASFGYSPDSMVLHDMTFQASQGSVTMVVGPVGSGKSTLLLGILGELYSDHGRVDVANSDVAYCQQSAWLPNQTIKESIVGDASFDQDWYRTTVDACCLDVDISRSSGGDDALIGSRGLTLSSGQRTRLSLARAVYSRKAVVLLDDVLSDLDARTQNAIFERLLSRRGLFKRNNITVIMATHTVQYLYGADHVIALDSQGHIVEQGNPTTLRAGDGYVNKLLAQSMQTKHGETGEPRNEVQAHQQTSFFPAHSTNPNNNDMQLRRMGDLSVYKYYAKHAGPFQMVLFFGLQFGVITFYKIPQLWLKWWTSSDGAGNDVYIVVMFVFAVAAYVIMICSISLMLIRVMPITGRSLHWTLLSIVCAAPMSFFTNTDSGIILNRFSQDMNIIDSHVPTAIGGIFHSIASIMWDTALVCYGSYYMAACIPVLAAVVYCIQLFYLRTSRQLRLLDLELKSPLFTHFNEMKDGLATIRAFGWQESFYQKFIQALDASQRPYYLLYMIQQWLGLCLSLLVAAVAVILVAFATQFRSQTSDSAIGIALVNVIGLSTTLANLIRQWTNLETSIGSIARLKQLEASVKPESSTGQADEPSTDWPSAGAVTYNNVCGAYDETAPIVLHNVNLQISPGEKIGVCGRTGSGKSTLISLLFRIIPVRSGTVKIDGQDIATISHDSVRGAIIAIPQSPYILSGSVRFNLAPDAASDDSSGTGHAMITDDEVITSLKTVGLWAIIERHGGLWVPIADIGLSQGQKQLLCLARAILRKDTSRLLVLDEISSSVDRHTDELMQSIIATEFEKHTVISVAHRLSSLKGCDRVIVMDEGRIVEQGVPDALLQKEDGWWKRLWDAQV